MTVYTHNAYVPHLTHYVTDHLSNLHGEIRPVGIAQHNSACTSFYSRQQAGHRVFRVVGVSLKEVLSIVVDFMPTTPEKGDRIIDHAYFLFPVHSEYVLHVEIRSLPQDAKHRE